MANRFERLLHLDWQFKCGTLTHFHHHQGLPHFDFGSEHFLRFRQTGFIILKKHYFMEQLLKMSRAAKCLEGRFPHKDQVVSCVHQQAMLDFASAAKANHDLCHLRN
jgi:hypothetical protein